ncbi:hypothetical protein CRUP_001464 [Coryphaenoides rupestris]|nr:hypothetical protein CRUP_001464 [Coryphaenoides rupestris]
MQAAEGPESSASKRRRKLSPAPLISIKDEPEDHSSFASSTPPGSNTSTSQTLLPGPLWAGGSDWCAVCRRGGGGGGGGGGGEELLCRCDKCLKVFHLACHAELPWRQRAETVVCVVRGPAVNSHLCTVNALLNDAPTCSVKTCLWISL